MSAFEILGYVGGAFAVATYAMRTMIPLRIMAIASNFVFIAYGAVASVYPVLLLHLLLLPLNGLRLWEMAQLVRRIRDAVHGEMHMEWLKPFMEKRDCRKGEVLFRRGDPAHTMFFTVTGKYWLRELNMEVPLGQIVGELGLLAPRNERSQTLECLEDGQVLTITYDQVRQLYFQNPEFGFYFLRLTSQRLFQNIARLEDEVIALRGRLAPS